MRSFPLRLLAGAVGLLCSLSAAAQDRQALPAYSSLPLSGPAPLTTHTGTPTDWRLTHGMTFNGVSFDGVARIAFDNDGSLSDGSYICSGTLLSGGTHVLTAAHCADDFNIMRVDFGVYGGTSTLTRGVAAAAVHPGWTGSNLAFGADLAVLKLDAPVTTIQGFNLSQSNDTGKSMLIMGYGTTGRGASTTDPDWSDWGWGHWGMNEADVTVQAFDAAVWPGAYPYHGDEYLFDFDNGTQTHNTLGQIAALTGNGWTSSTGLGADEALVAGGDSGGGDFVWNGSEWLLSGVHSWGWQACGDLGLGCDYSDTAFSSYGDLSGSTAVFSHLAWIDSVTAVPEPQTYAMMLLGLGVLGSLKRRRTR